MTILGVPKDIYRFIAPYQPERPTNEVLSLLVIDIMSGMFDTILSDALLNGITIYDVNDYLCHFHTMVENNNNTLPETYINKPTSKITKHWIATYPELLL